MKRLTLLLSITLFTFMTGVAINWGFYRTLGTPSIAENVLPRSRDPNPGSEVDVEFLGFIESEPGTVAEFQVSNWGSETAYYWGYSKDSHCADLIRYDFEVERASFCWCGTGLEEQSLKRGETVKFDVWVRDTTVPFEVGFDFGVGKDRSKRSYWSKRIVRDSRIGRETKTLQATGVSHTI